ncbi:MAG TPA: type VI secretion system ImpA family N-terminal domain-containing protein [Acidobacteriota bacterium]|nr:type VI secretion system ImpA family N-terminal domain-containing protein [Acidobacteriota bacterium]HQF86023.1 type VI secretion system ImpA family N-terminal domain-containing protein [Acidobacteriota bacterium]HQG90734.1 type VI secretion system ImpA family N-terminal domain-containing protein [Acidobacteriota bacterium]HQK86899.1 type VI secretion system ImpA family N-terminal domain-containing protein [Acidobacteriota bacterium]
MSDWKELGRTPVAPGNPAGSDVQDLPAYAALEAEMGKLNSPSAASSIDWSQVARLADDILSRYSKHLLVAGYYSVALLNTDRLRGLARGVRVLRDLLDHFWDTMYPSVRRMRGRKNAVEWWYEKVQAAARNLPREEWSEADRQAF